MKISNLIASLFLAVVLIWGCSSSQDEAREKKLANLKSPVDDIIKTLDDTTDYSILLYDMDADDDFKKFKHKYRIIAVHDSFPGQDSSQVVTTDTTDWKVVTEDFFVDNAEYMGMELASKNHGKVIRPKVPSPAGYSNHVGNTRYGSWRTNDSGNSYWAFYGRYMMFSSMLHMATYPIYRSGYGAYRSSYSAGRPYYGTSTTGGGRMYGSGGSYTSATRSSSTWGRKMSQPGFKSKINNRVSQSKTTRASKTSRSGSRYSGKSSKGGGGGSGK